MKKGSIGNRFSASGDRYTGAAKSWFGKALWALMTVFAVSVYATDSTVTAGYWLTTFSDPTSTIQANQAIFAGSQPTVIMKFDRTMTFVTNGTFNGAYTETAAPYYLKPRGATTFAGAGSRYDDEHWDSNSWLVTATQLASQDTTFNSADDERVNNNWRENGVTFRVIVDDSDGADVKVNPKLIKSVQLWKSRVNSTFNHKNIIPATSNLAETFGTVLVEEKTNSGSQTEYVFNIASDVRETTRYDYMVSNTTHFFVTIKTVDNLADNNKWNETDDSAEDEPVYTRKELKFKWKRDGYTSNTITTNGSERATKEIPLANSLTFESSVYDVLPYESYTDNYSSSVKGVEDMMVITLKQGPGNEGFPPSSLSEFTNSQLKFLTVNGPEYFAESEDYEGMMSIPFVGTIPTKQAYDTESMMWAVGEAQKTLMPLNEPFAVLGINIAGTTGDETDNTENLFQIGVRIDVPANSSFDPRRDLSNSLTTEAGHENISVFKDVNGNGFFDDADKASGQVALTYDFMSGEVKNSAWKKSGNSYTATLTIAEQKNSQLEKTQNGLSKFFICLCTNPSDKQDTQQPFYGSDFTLAVTSVQCHRQAGLANGSPEDPFVSDYGYTLGEGFANADNLAKSFNDVTSRPVTIGLEVSQYVDNQMTGGHPYFLDSVRPDPLEADGMPVPVLAINMAGSPSANVNEKLHSVKVRFASAGFNPTKHIAPLTGDALSGVSIWKDNKDGGDSNIGVFDPRMGINPSAPFGNYENTDTVVELAPDCLKWYFHDGATNTDSEWDGTQSISAAGDYFYVLLKFQSAIELYDNDDYYDKSSTNFTPKNGQNMSASGTPEKGKFRGRDYFICVRGAGQDLDYNTPETRGLDYNDKFGISIVPSKDLLFGYGEDAVDPKKYSDAITTNVEATMPVFFTEPNTNGTYDIYRKTALLAFSVVAPNDGNQYTFNHFAFQVIDMNNTFALSDFVDLGDTGDTCGISLWRDNGDGTFDENTDQRITYRKVNDNDLPKITTMTWLDGRIHMIELNLDPASVGVLPTTDDGRRADFFLVFQPSKNITVGDQLTLQIHGSDLLGTRDDTFTFGTLAGTTFTPLANPDGSDRTTPGTYKRFLSKTYTAIEGLEDYYTIDTDNDGIPDWWEEMYFGRLDIAGYGINGEYTDFDMDGLNDYYEYLSNTNPTKPDTDGNGTQDGKEDTDDDGLTNLEEQRWGTDPNNVDSDDDGISDKDEVDAKTSPLHSMSPAIARSFKLSALNGTEAQATGLEVPLTDYERGAGLSTWTVEAWVNPGASAVNGVLFKRTVNEMNAFEIGLADNVLYVETDCADGTTQRVEYPAALPASTWTHVAVVWNSGTAEMSLIINGQSQVVREFDSEPVNFWTYWTPEEYTISDGSNENPLGSYKVNREYNLYLFPNAENWADDVRVDEVRIWSIARDITEISEKCDTLIGKADAPFGLMRCYRFDDGGETIEDFAHPGWQNFNAYALKPGVDEWSDSEDAAALYGMDDTNANGMPDWFESFYGVTDAMGDEDGDGLVNLYEYLCGTDPTDKKNGTDDFDAMSADEQLTNGQKQYFGLDPRLADSDGDGLSDYDEINGTDQTFPKGANENDTASDPLNPMNNLKPELNTLKHFEFTGAEDGLALKATSKYALESWTVMAWVKTDDDSQTSSLIKRQTSENGITYELGLNGGTPYVKFSTKNGGDTGTFQAPKDPASATKLKLESGKWTHLAGSFDSETGVLRLYVNGMPVAETIELKKRAELYGDGVIGGEFVGAKVALGQGFTGSMDSVQFYDSALENAVISDIYHSMESGSMGIAKPYYTESEETAGVDAINMAMSVDELLAVDHVDNQLLVKFNSSVSEEMIQRAHAMLGTKTLKKFPVTGTYLIEVPRTIDLKSGIEKLRKMNAIEFVEPNYKVQLNAVPNDPFFTDLWGMKNSSYPGNDIGATEAWDISTGSKKVIVAVIDSGVDYTHPDLAANMWVNKNEIPDNGIDDDNNGYVDDVYGYDFGDGDNDPMPGHAHGTHCAGTIGAVGNNGAGVAGVNWNVTLMALKCGVGDTISIGNTTEAYEYAIAMGANVMSCSFGGTGYSAAAYRALREAQKKGILVIAAAGNDTTNNDLVPHYPSSYELDNIISVASMDSNGKPSSFTNYGKTSVDIAAPGGSIYSTVPNGGYDYMSGTSMATPHVSGMAAWLKCVYPKATYQMLREALLRGTVPNANWNGLITTGGMANLPRAYAILAKNSGGRKFASGLIAAFRGNAVFGDKVLDLTETELGATAQGVYEAAPTVGRYAADLVNATADETAREDYANFNGDSDGDGMPDWYEVQVSHNPMEADGDVDTDKDGLTNYFEYLAGTSPWNSMTDGETADADLTLAFGENLTYADAQRLGIYPRAEKDGFTDYDTDDDGITDKEESGYGESRFNIGRADDALIPYRNRVLQFSGTAGSYMLLPNQARYVLSNNWSLDLWIKIDPTLEGDAVLVKRTIDTKAAGNAADILVNYELGITKEGNFWKPYVTFIVKDENGNKVTRTCKAYSGIAANVWAHVGAVYKTQGEDDDATAEMSIYLNNVRSNTTDCTGVNMNGDTVGISEVRVGEGFLGSIEAVRIWSVAKSDFHDFKNAAENAISDYAPRGLEASFIFDDGGLTAQNFAVSQDDWKEGWLNAATLVAADGGTIEMVEDITSPVKGEDKDSDGDGLPDWWEMYFGLDPYDATGDNGADGDPDGDGLTNAFEYSTWPFDDFLDPTNPRTWNDEEDGSLDSDGDNLVNSLELKYGTNPGNPDTDDDGLNDYVELFGDFETEEEESATGPLDPMSPLVWRALRGEGSAEDTLVIPETDRILGHDDTDTETKDWTIEAWFMPTDDAALTGSILRRTGLDAKGELQYYFDMGLKDGKPYVRATMKSKWQVSADEDTNILEVFAQNGIVARKNVWTHYAATWNSARNVLTLYINGVFAGSRYSIGDGLVDGGVSTTGFVTEIFGENEGSYLMGYVDEIRVWTDTDEGRKGLRLPKQIREYMAKALKVKTDDENINDYTALPTAYYRFDDGGIYAEDFAYSVAEERDNAWPHALLTADGSEQADLSARMLSSWNAEFGDDTLGAYWYESNASERAICMNGTGSTELDPIPNGWKQVYWPDAKAKFGVNAGDGYDFNQGFALSAGGDRTEQETPVAIPGESSSFVNTVTGELKSNEIVHGGAPLDAYIYFTELYFDNIPANLSVNLSWLLGNVPGNKDSNYGVNEIYIFVNGQRVGFGPNSQGRPGEDVYNHLTRQVYGQAKVGGYAYYEISSTAVISGTIDIAKHMVKGRNRITILANHTDVSDATGHPTPYRFYARVRINGNPPDNLYENWPTHVRWFWSQQYPWTYNGNPGAHVIDSDKIDTTSYYESTVYIYDVYPSQETADMCHTLEADGTNRLLFWFEKYFAVYPWGYDQDPDGDGLTNWTEYLANTTPLDMDVDGDGRSDANMDHDKDGLFNSVEQALETMPHMEDTDDDGQNDYYEANNGSDPLDGKNAFERDNLVLNLTGKYILNVPEVGDDKAVEELDSWTIQVKVKLTEAPAEKAVIVRRTTGRYEVGDVSNYELGITPEGLPYAGFSVVNEDATTLMDIFATMTVQGGYEPLVAAAAAEDDGDGDGDGGEEAAATGKWYTVYAVFNAPDERAQGGYIAIYVYDEEGNMTSLVRNNVAMKPSKTMTGIGGITIGGRLPDDDETMDGETVLKNAFVGQIDNLAIWNSAFLAEPPKKSDGTVDTTHKYNVKYNYDKGLKTMLASSNVFHCYNLKVPTPSYRVDSQLVHAYMFDDGGKSIEDMAIMNDWYNGHAHAIAAPMIPNYAIYDVEVDEETERTDAQGNPVYDADGNVVYEVKDKEGITNVLVADATSTEVDTLSEDDDNLPDSWERSHYKDVTLYGDLDDPDEDGLVNIYEYYAGKNPLKKETVIGKNDALEDTDLDGLKNYEEQMYGTHPNNIDTDDDGVTDFEEVQAGRNPLKAEASNSYYVEVPAKGTLVYPAEEIDVTGTVTLSAWICLPSASVSTYTGVIASRGSNVVGDQFKLEIVNGKVKFTFGMTAVTASRAIRASVADKTWFKVTALRSDSMLSLTINEDLDGSTQYAEENTYMTDNHAAAITPSTKDIVIGDAANEEMFGIDEFKLYGTTTVTTTTTQNNQTVTVTNTVNTYLITSDFDDLGTTFENSASKDKLTLIPGLSFIDQEKSAARAYVDGTEDTTVAGTGTVVDPIKHSWFKGTDRAGDENHNMIPDQWEYMYFGKLLDEGEEYEEYVNGINPITGKMELMGDDDGLCVLYEYFSGNDPLNTWTNGIDEDGDLDYDNDGVINLEEQYNATRPDKWDTDDDGYSDAFEGGYDFYVGGEVVDGIYTNANPEEPMVGLRADYGVLGDNSQIQPNKPEPKTEEEYNAFDFSDLALASITEYTKIFRLDGTNRMAVANNADHTGNKLTIGFWFRPVIVDETGAEDLEKTTILAKETKDITFLRRTVDANKGYNNYGFKFNGKSITFWVESKGSYMGTQAVYTPADGFKSGKWYYIAGMFDVDPTTTNRYVQIVGLDGEWDLSSNTFNYVAQQPVTSFTKKNGANVGEMGKLILGSAEGEELEERFFGMQSFVIDIDNLCVWTGAKTPASIKLMAESNTMGYGAFTEGLVSQFLFDDGGETVEDFCHEADWWTDWKNAGVMNVPTVARTEENVGRGMIFDGTLSNVDNDKDKDGLPDDWELFFFGSLDFGPDDDPDNDGVTNIDEYNLSPSFRDATLGANPAFDEELAWLNPYNSDTDGDGLSDKYEIDYGTVLNPLDPDDAELDADNDGVPNWKEAEFGTDPTNPDTDNDGLPDGWEIQYTKKDKDGNITDPSLNPLNPSGPYGPDGDPDGDGITNTDEYLYGTNPLVADSNDGDTDGDGLADIEEREKGVNTDSRLTDTDDDGYADYSEVSNGTKGYDSWSKVSHAENASDFVYRGNLVGQIAPAHGVLTIPAAGDADRLGFHAWTIEARFRLINMPSTKILWEQQFGTDQTEYDVYLIRRSYTDTPVADNAAVADAECWNYAIGYRVYKDDIGVVYPFVSFLAKDGTKLQLNSETGITINLETSKPDRSNSTWHFLTGVYNATAREMAMYMDGELVTSKIFTEVPECPLTIRQSGKTNAYVKIGENFANVAAPAEDMAFADNAKLYIDEIRIWGVKPKTIAVVGSGSSSNYVSDFVRTMAEIVDGHTRPVMPTKGIYDAGLGDRYVTVKNNQPYGTNKHAYTVDPKISDGVWTTKGGTRGQPVTLCYYDANDNGKWDYGEDVWRDRTPAQAVLEDSNGADTGEGATGVSTAMKYDDMIDMKIAQGTNGWVPGFPTTRQVIGADGKATTVTVSESETSVGSPLECFYIDRNANGYCDSADDIWFDYEVESEVESWYVPAVSRWTESEGLALYINFDDGGATIEDYAHLADWRSAPVWKYAIRPIGLEGVFPPAAPTAIGGKDNDYQYVTEALDDDYAWVINAFDKPSDPEIAIHTLNGETDTAYIPATPETSAANTYDVLSANLDKAAVDPEGALITYMYYWLKTPAGAEEIAVDALSFVDGDLMVDGEVITNNRLLGTDEELDLYMIRDRISDGDKITLVVVATSESGMSSTITAGNVDTVTLEAKDGRNASTREGLLAPVAFQGWSTMKNGATVAATAGKSFSVNLKNQSAEAGYIHIDWYRNLLKYSEAEASAAAGATVSFAVAAGDVVNGDVWSYKARFETTDRANVSRTTPPEDDDYATTTDISERHDWIYIMVGKGYDEEIVATSNRAPSTPTSVTITPSDADVSSLLIATASGSRDADGDKFGYFYQWYKNGAEVAGEIYPFYPSTGTMAAGDVITVRVWAKDVYGNSSTRLTSSSVIVQASLETSTLGSSYAYEDNDSMATATRLLPKTNWTAISEANVQEHYFKSAYDMDWFKFEVPASLSNKPVLVKFETNGGIEMFSKTHTKDKDYGEDTRLDLYDANGAVLLSNDNYLEDGGETIYARFETELNPGVYYVRVYRAGNASSYTGLNPYYVHLGFFEAAGPEGPSAPTKVELTYDDTLEALVCTAEGSTASSGGAITYVYVWYRNDEVVPFSSGSTVTSWNTALYEVSFAKTGTDGNKVPKKYISAGDKWACVVYAKNSNGYSDPVEAEYPEDAMSIVKYWGMALDVTKTFRSSTVNAVTGSDQRVIIGQDSNATYGFDPSFDSAATSPYDVVGTVTTLPRGAMFSVGMDNTYTRLNKDIRPYGKSSSWFIKIEMGSESSGIESCTLTWPSTELAGLTMTRMRETTERTWEAIEGTTIDMTAVTEVALTEEDLETVQTDANGQKFVVYRITLGAADSGQTLTLKKGWNMISFAVTPKENAVTDVFKTADGASLLGNGDVWWYTEGKYGPVDSVYSGLGYWMYSTKSTTLTVYGDRNTDGLPLKEGWNLIGPVYNVAKIGATYRDFIGTDKVIPQIYLVETSTGGEVTYTELGPNDPMRVGKVYWLKCTRNMTLPVYPTLD